MDKIKKNLYEIFKNNDLGLIRECNIKIANYLDVTFNLYQKHIIYKKPSVSMSNHPPNIITHIPETTGKC